MKLATHDSDHQDSPAEEAASAITHLVALLLSAAGFGMLVYQADLLDSWKALFAAIVYGTSLILLFLSSTLYHGLRHHGSRRFFLAFDHVAIFLLIAGTNTPVVLLGLSSPTSYVLFGVIWGLAVVGILLRLFWFSGFQWASLPLYLILGWISLAWAGPLSQQLGTAGVWLIVAGGLCYSLGTVFYLLRRLRFNHAIWHFWVLAGAVCHFLAVQVYAMPSLA